VKKNLLLIPLMTPLLSLGANTLEPIQVTSERVSKSLDKVSSSVVVFTTEDIENSRAQTLAGLLKRVPGLYVRENSAFGKTTNFYIRGAKTSYTRVIVDGIKVNDPTTTEGEFNFSSFTLENIERIEIIKGSQGVLYGPDAIAGVLKITTKKGTKDTKASVRAGLGSYDNKLFLGTVSGKSSIFDYSFGIDTQKVEGISSFNEKRTTNADADGHEHVNANLNLGLDLNKLGSVRALVRRSYSSSEFDSTGVDVADAFNRVTQSLFALNYSNDFFDKNLETSFKVGVADVDRETFGVFTATYEGKTHTLESSNTLKISKNDDAFFGVRYEHNEMKSSAFANKDEARSNESKGIFLGNYFELGELFSDQGVSYDDFGRYGDEVTYRLGGGYKFSTNTILKSSYATGFKAPVLDQINASFYGNADLQAFKSKNYEVSLIQNWKMIEAQATYFSTDIENEIAYDTTKFKYFNVAETKLYGWEFSLSSVVGESLRVDLGAEFIRTQQVVGANAGAYLSERPRQKYSAGFEYFLSDNLTLNTDYLYIGTRNDSSGRLPSFYLVDLGLDYKLNSNFDISLQINNVLDKEYEQIRTFGTLGRDFKFFVKWQI